jgi:membrane associated rhomboid family serine protease
VFFPIHDDNPLRSIRAPFVTISLILINVLVYLYELSPQGQVVAASFAIVPSELFQVGILGGPARGIRDVLPVPESSTLLTYMFLHGDPFHLIGNMLFLWVFGDNIEDAMGHTRFLAFYLACGVFAGLVHAIVVQNWMPAMGGVPLIGASGAVAGVIAAYLMLHPRVRVWVLAFRIIPLRITALLALGAWILSQFAMLLIPNVGPVAWWAHVGGIIAGGVLILFMRRPGVGLFDRRPETAV